MYTDAVVVGLPSSQIKLIFVFNGNILFYKEMESFPHGTSNRNKTYTIADTVHITSNMLTIFKLLYLSFFITIFELFNDLWIIALTFLITIFELFNNLWIIVLTFLYSDLWII